MAIGICIAVVARRRSSMHGKLEKVLSTCGFNILDLIPMRRQNTDLKLGIINTTGNGWRIILHLNKNKRVEELRQLFQLY